MAHYLLDVNETLSDMSPIGAVLTAHGAPPGLAGAWFAGVLRDGIALSVHGRGPAFLDVARDGLRFVLSGVDGLDAEVEDVVEEVLETLGGLGVHPDVVPGIRALVAAGHQVSVLSNGSVTATEGLLERAGVRDGVSHVMSVEVGAVWKPHPDAYGIAVDRLGVPADDLTLVAVHPWDLDGAASAGLRTAWVDRRGAPWPAVFREPDVRVTTLTGLVEAEA